MIIGKSIIFETRNSKASQMKKKTENEITSLIRRDAYWSNGFTESDWYRKFKGRLIS